MEKWIPGTIVARLGDLYYEIDYLPRKNVYAICQSELSVLSIDLQVVIFVINYIKSMPLKSRIFTCLCEDMCDEHMYIIVVLFLIQVAKM